MSNITISAAELASIKSQIVDGQNGTDIVFLTFCSALVILMQVGFAYVEAGSVRVKNVRSIMLKNMIDYVLGAILYCLIGHGMAQGKSAAGIIGTDGYGGLQPSTDSTTGSKWIAVMGYSSLFACTTTTIISGAIAERFKLSAYVFISIVIPLTCYALPAHWIWNDDGWLRTSFKDVPFIDAAGGAAVHASGGTCALVASWFVGARIGRYRSHTGYGNEMKGHSIVLLGLGAWMIIFGWIGFNAGSTYGVSTESDALKVSKSVINTFISVAGSAVTSMVAHVLVFGKINLGEVFNCMLAGAAAITAGCASVQVWSALAIGCIGCVAYMFFSPFLGKTLRIDDPVGAIGVHLGAGFVGTLMLGFLDETHGLLYTGTFWSLGVQLLGLVAITANAAMWTAMALTIFTLAIGVVRVPERIEIKGCDVELDGMAAYDQTKDVHMQFTTIRENPKLYEELGKFLKSIYCFENISFIEAVEAYEKELMEKAKFDAHASARKIYETFMEEGCPSPINLPGWQVKQVEKMLETIQKTTTMKKMRRSKSREMKEKAIEKEIAMVELGPNDMISGDESADMDSVVALPPSAKSWKVIFSTSKAEIVGLLDNTIRIHFRKTKQYREFTQKLKSNAKLPLLHYVAKLPCCTTGRKKKYGRPKPFDPLNRFHHIERLTYEYEVGIEDDSSSKMLGGETFSMNTHSVTGKSTSSVNHAIGNVETL